MNREVVNLIRNVLENWIPAVLRDSVLFYPLLYLVFGKKTRYYAEFRQKTPHLTLEEYAQYYRDFPHVMGDTDLNQACIARILADIDGETVLDAGCGRGFLSKAIKQAHPGKTVTGVDIHLNDALKADQTSGVTFMEAFVEKLPFPDKAFDTVTCTHTLEHVIHIEPVLKELRRVARKRLIIVVPREREYLYSFNLHVNFFPYQHSFLNRVDSQGREHVCELLDGDIYYQETCA